MAWNLKCRYCIFTYLGRYHTDILRQEGFFEVTFFTLSNDTSFIITRQSKFFEEQSVRNSYYFLIFFCLLSFIPWKAFCCKVSRFDVSHNNKNNYKYLQVTLSAHPMSSKTKTKTKPIKMSSGKHPMFYKSFRNKYLNRVQHKWPDLWKYFN